MSTTTQHTPSLTPRTAAVQKQRVPDHEFVERRVAAAQATRDVRPAKSGMHPVGPIVKTVEAFRWKLLGHIDIVGHGPCLCTQDRKTQRRAALMIDPELNKPHWQEVTPERPVAPEAAAVAVAAPPPTPGYRNAELATSIARYHQMLQWDAEDRCFDGDYDWAQQAAAIRAELIVEGGVDPQDYTVDLPGFDAAVLMAEEAAEAGAAYVEPSWAAFVRYTPTQQEAA
jgi:hypothetical protein